MIQPVFMTYERNTLKFTKQFVESYMNTNLAVPVVVVDTTLKNIIGKEYLDYINKLSNNIHIYKEDVINHPDSMFRTMKHTLELSLKYTNEDDIILWLEDDIIFSRKFSEIINTFQMPIDAGFVTLYSHGTGFQEKNCHPTSELLRFSPEPFYGAQCLLFPRNSIELLNNNYDYIQNKYIDHPTWFWDLRWALFLHYDCNLSLYQTYYSYVQHIGSISYLGHGFHQTARYYDEVFKK